MEITKETKLKELVDLYPWLKGELAGINEKFKMLSTPMGKVMLGRVTVGDMSNNSGMDADVLIARMTELIESHSL